MSSKSRVRTSLAGVDFSSMTRDELYRVFNKILAEGIHGISFSVYLENQAPGTKISAEQIRARMNIIQPYVKWIRSFSCVDGNELIPGIAHEYGLKTLVGAWLGTDEEKNEQEIEGVIEVAKAGHADIIAVGNEVLLRGDLSAEKVVDYMDRVKRAVPGVPVGYVDAYYEFTLHPRVSEACDIIFANCYPFWEGYPLEHSLLYLKDMYHHAMRAGKGKRIIISETGWPNRGSAERSAVPSDENAVKYFINAFQWAADEGIEVFYFSSFDETWKIAAEGDVGAYWGLWDKDGHLKYQ
ncbi:glycosyl hydrolase [candidate division KSB1 bacterium]|nr:glycosyl hydrolase [candidate division KSB1 bacterium]